MPSWIGPWEIAIVVIIALLIFGPSKLPGLGSSLGKSISGFKRGLQESQDEFRTALKDDAEATISAEATSTRAAAQAAPAKDPIIVTTTVEPPSAR